MKQIGLYYVLIALSLESNENVKNLRYMPWKPLDRYLSEVSMAYTSNS